MHRMSLGAIGLVLYTLYIHFYTALVWNEYGIRGVGGVYVSLYPPEWRYAYACACACMYAYEAGRQAWLLSLQFKAKCAIPDDSA